MIAIGYLAIGLIVLAIHIAITKPAINLRDGWGMAMLAAIVLLWPAWIVFVAGFYLTFPRE